MSARRRTSSKRRFCLWSSAAKQKRANRLEHPSVASHRIHLDVHNPDLSLDRYCYSSGLSNGTSRYQCSQRASCHYRPARPKFELVRTSGTRSIHTRGESLECKELGRNKVEQGERCDPAAWACEARPSFVSQERCLKRVLEHAVAQRHINKRTHPRPSGTQGVLGA